MQYIRVINVTNRQVLQNGTEALIASLLMLIAALPKFMSGLVVSIAESADSILKAADLLLKLLVVEKIQSDIQILYR